jgi:hypothetical protein
LAAKFKVLGAVVVVTDGQPDNKKTALAAAGILKKRGIDIVCIGTDDADQEFLSKLASGSEMSFHVDASDLRATLQNASTLLLGRGK